LALPQPPEDLVVGLRPLVRFLLQEGGDEAFHRRGDNGVHAPERARDRLQVEPLDLAARLSQEWGAAGEHLEEQHTESVEVGAVGDLRGIDDLLGRGVEGSSEELESVGLVVPPRRERDLGDPKVGDFQFPVAGDEDVSRLQVAMHNAAAVDKLEHLHDLGGQPDGDDLLESVHHAEQPAEVTPHDQLERQVVVAL
jgi:hypothetical protein